MQFFRKAKRWLQEREKDKSGQAMIEYAAIVALVSILSAGAVGGVGGAIGGTLDEVADKIVGEPPVITVPDDNQGSGQIGDEVNGVSWFITSATNEISPSQLFIYPTNGVSGIMWDTAFEQDVPWHPLSEIVKTAKIAPGVIAHNTIAYMFVDCINMTEITGLENLNVSDVTDMGGVFNNCSSLANIQGLDKWDTSKATGMYDFFNGCASVKALNLNNFKTENVTNMNCMFTGCSALTSLNVSSFNTSKVTNMCDMFSNCSNLALLDLTNFDVHSVTRLDGMFQEDSKLKTIAGLDGWNVSSTADQTYMFYNCPADRPDWNK